jgi:hypothetical protein
MAILFDGVPHFKQIINEESHLHFGLGGSLLSESFSFNNNAALIAYPFLAIAYLEFVNYLRRCAGFFGVIVFVFYMVSTHSIFRGGLFFVAIDPIYYAIYAVFWYWFYSITLRKRILLPPILKIHGRKNDVARHHVLPVS